MYYKIIFLFILTLTSNLCALIKSKPEFASKKDADIYLQTHYNLGSKYYNNKQWSSAANEFEKIIYFFKGDESISEAYYFLGISYFEMHEYEWANNAFSDYLKNALHPHYFDDTLSYKFYIAEYYKCGKKKRVFGASYSPKWSSGYDIALSAYDEIIMSVPNQEIAARSLYSKGELLHSMGEFRDSIEAYQTLIRRFPRHELTPDSYVKIAQAYCEMARLDFQNPDILALAELNARKFRDDFPREERVEIVDGYVLRIKEMYAKGLCDIGLLYQRMGKPHAAAIYFRSSIEEFPDTFIADFCRKRLSTLDCDAELLNTECEDD